MKDYGWPHREFLIREVRHARRNRVLFRVLMVAVVVYFGGHMIYAFSGGPTYPVVLDRPVY